MKWAILTLIETHMKFLASITSASNRATSKNTNSKHTGDYRFQVQNLSQKRGKTFRFEK